MKKIVLLLSVVLAICISTFAMACDSILPKKEKEPVNTEFEISVIDGTGSGKYKEGDIVTVSATIPENKEFVNWTVDDEVVSTANPYSFTCSKDLTIKANFNLIEEVTLTVIGGEGSGVFKAGETVTVSAIIPKNKEFVSWKIDGNVVSSLSEYSFEINEDTTISAEFKSDFYKYVSTVNKENGEDFVILNLTDIQLHNGNSLDITFEVIDQLVAKTNPNMIVFLGDLLNDNDTYGSKDTANAILDKIDSFGIPWAFIFGNHDYEDYQAGYESKKDYPSYEMIETFATYDNCLFKRGPSNVSGNSNYVINIVDEDNNVIKSLIMLDSRLSGLDDSNTAFYNRAVDEIREMNNGEDVENIVYTHIAIPAYGEAYLQSQSVEFSTVVGSLNRKASDLATGTTSLFDSIIEKGLTKNVICGHDHENAYYINYQGVNLIFSMKSSDGDHYDNVAEIGGSYFTIGENVEIDYVKANITLDVKQEEKNNQTFALDTLADWQYSGAYLTFDIENLGNGDGYAKYALFGTNIKRDISENDKYGSWNRLTSYVTIDFATKTASIGELTLIENNKYSYRANLVDYILNTGSELSDGTETLRLLFFNEFTEDFAIGNIKYEFIEEIADDKIDLSNAEITINDEYIYTGNEIVPEISVKVGDDTLRAKYDYKIVLANNIEIGTATLKVIPSGLGKNTWKGEKEISFNIIADPYANYRGEKFFESIDKVIDIEDGGYDYVEFDYLITNGSEKAIKVKVYGNGWDKYYGTITLTMTESLDVTTGVEITQCTDEYAHVKLDLTLVNRTNTAWNRDNAPSQVEFIYLTSDTTANGFIDNITFGKYTTPPIETFSLTKNGYIDIKALVPNNVSTVSFEYKFGNTDKVLNIRLADESGYGDNNYYGMYRIFNGTATSQYTGSKSGSFAVDASSACAVESLSDGWYKITFNVSNMSKTGTVNKIGYIFADKFSDGTAEIRNIVCK